MKSFRILIIGFAALIVCFIVTLAISLNAIANLEDKAKSRVGDKVVIGSDTAIILDYSLFKETYTLSNGQEINFSYFNDGK